MELIKILQQMKTIKPDADYTARSRDRLLATIECSDRAYVYSFNWQSRLANLFRSGGAIAFMSLFLLFILGGFSAWNISLPGSGLDVSALEAEAQAIDIQIELADLSYQEIVVSEEEKSIIENVVETISQVISDEEVEESDENLTVDDLLKILSE